MYVNRHLEVVLQKASKMFGAVLVTGPRQVGKTTLLRKFSQDAAYVTLDDPMQLHAAIEEPATFFKDNKPPVFVDEIQYAHNLFPCIAEPPLYFYRDKEQQEIDLLIEDNGVLYPLKMKKHADPKASDIKAFAVLDNIPGMQRGSGGVICTYDKLVTLKDNDKVIPIAYI